MIRGDIQGLRALAVAAVFVFHAWPAALPGGFVGVDVFFVVSGYLITGLLVREVDRTGAVDLPAFYGRRVRRLLPAATLVLAVVAALAPALLPATRWRDVAWDTVASVFYAQNWNLAARAVDYQAEGAAASPLQHFWSLAIEEQFYFLWPGLLSALAWAGGRRWAPVALGAVAAASLAASVWLTATAPQAAYFVTHTRLWELALGGLLATLPAAATPRPWLAVPGLVGVAASAGLVRPEHPFPGWLALAPTLACAAVLLGGGEGPVARLLSAAPLRWLGDRSYAVYLWHWPLAVAWQAQGGEPGPLAAAAIALMTASLSDASYQLVEQRFRHPRPGDPPAPALALASLAPLAAAGALLWRIGATTAPDDDGAPDPRYPGGALVFAGAVAPPVDAVRPDPATARLDGPRGPHCQLDDVETEPRACALGVEGGREVWLIGDSHASHWLPALEPIARERGWSLTVHAKQACALATVPIVRDGAPYATCLAWGERLRDQLEADPPAAVILSHSGWHRPVGDKRGIDEAMVAAERALWAELRAHGTLVVAMPDVPRFGFDPVDCYASGKATCSVNRSTARSRPDVVARAAAGTGVKVLDLVDLACPGGECVPVVGNVLVWRDDGHLTRTYVLTLVPEVSRRLAALGL